MFEDKKYFISGFRNKGFVLKNNLKDWKEVTTRVASKLKFIHRFKSLLVQEVLIFSATEVVGPLEIGE